MLMTAKRSGTQQTSDVFPQVEKKLSEIATHLVLPSGTVGTAFTKYKPQLERMGTVLDPWQEQLSKAIFAVRSDGKYAAGIGGVVISICRQGGKTKVIGDDVFSVISKEPNQLVLWSAHRVKTHNETFKTLSAHAQEERVAPYIKQVRNGAGQEAIEFTNGSRILFGAREHGFGRGFAKVDILVLDEAQILTEKAMEDMVPATNASPNGLVIMMGTPPRPGDPGDVFTQRRKDALSGDDQDILYVEFSADKNANPDDEKQWAKANPSFPHRTSRTSILRMKKLLGPESFRREALGIWTEEGDDFKPAVSYSGWEKQAIKDDIPSGRQCFGVKFSSDGSSWALSGAVKPDDTDAPIHVEAIKQGLTSEGTEWIVNFLVERKDKIATVVIDGKSGVGYLVSELKARGVKSLAITTPSLDQVQAAHSILDALVLSGGFTHSNQSQLNQQVKGATRRPIGKQGGFGWAPTSDDGTVVSFDAVTLALWGAKTTKRRPGRKAGFL